MGYIIGKKSDESFVTETIKAPEWIIANLHISIVANFGGVAADYSYYQMTQNEVDRFQNGDDYVLTWAAKEITALDFTTEDAKRHIKIYADKSEIDDDGIDTAQITIEVWKADKSAIDTAVTATKKLIISAPTGIIPVKVTVTNGTVTRPFKTTKAGTWIFPADSQRVGNLNVLGNQLEIEVIGDSMRNLCGSAISFFAVKNKVDLARSIVSIVTSLFVSPEPNETVPLCLLSGTSAAIIEYYPQ